MTRSAGSATPYAAIPRRKRHELVSIAGVTGRFPIFHQDVLPGGAKEIRTPDLLHAIWRQHVHPRPSPQVTVLPRPHECARVRVSCGTSVLYSPTRRQRPAASRTACPSTSSLRRSRDLSPRETLLVPLRHQSLPPGRLRPSFNRRTSCSVSSLICRIAGVARAHSHALPDIFHRSSMAAMIADSNRIIPSSGTAEG